MTEVQSSPRSARSSTTLEGDSPAKGGSKSNPGSPLDKPVLKQVKSASNIPASAPPMSPPIFLTDTHTDQTEHLSSPPAAYGPVSNSFSENAKKRRSNLKGLENLTLNMIQAPIKLTKQLTHAVGATTPESKHDSGDFDYFGPKAAKTPMTQEEKEKRAWEKEKRRRKKAREKKRQEQIFVRRLLFSSVAVRCGPSLTVAACARPADYDARRCDPGPAGLPPQAHESAHDVRCACTAPAAPVGGHSF